jgi:hypothetical protein
MCRHGAPDPTVPKCGDIAAHAVQKLDRRRTVAGLPRKRLYLQACGRISSRRRDQRVKYQLLLASIVVASVAGPLVAQAQGVPGGISHGMYEGNRRAGPIGAVVGGAVGGVIGGVEGVLGLDGGYRTYSDGPPRVYRYRQRVRHLHRRVRHRHAAR